MAGLSPFRQCDVELFLHLSPRYQHALTTGVYEQLGRMLMAYRDDFEGVAVAFSNVTLRDGLGAIVADDPRLHVRVSARTTVFSPPIGCVLRGTVNKVSSDHIGLLVHDAFNAAIGRQHMPADFVFDRGLQAWNRSDPTVPITVGSAVSLAVVGLEAANGVMAIVGSLLPADLHEDKPEEQEAAENQGEEAEQEQENGYTVSSNFTSA
jgi:DNA-directed RNA polymerase I subunit RPA43